MMLLQGGRGLWNSALSSPSESCCPFHHHSHAYDVFSSRAPRSKMKKAPKHKHTSITCFTSSSRFLFRFRLRCCLRVGLDQVREIAYNKVLVAAAISAAVGQLSKPFTSAFFYGNNNESFDWKAAFRAGGFPSTHSSAAVATATTLGLERGFSDALFGLAVVYASLIMYDAQGVRREVGTHARVLNRLLPMNQQNTVPTTTTSGVGNLVDYSGGKSSSTLDSLESLFLEEPGSPGADLGNASVYVASGNRDSKTTPTMQISSGLAAKAGQGPVIVANDCKQLKEFIGHTEIEVVAGAALGVFVSLAVCTII